MQKILEEDKPTIEEKTLVCLQLTKREYAMEKSLESKIIKHENMLCVSNNGERTTRIFPVLKRDS